MLVKQRVGILRSQIEPGDIVMRLDSKANLGPGWNHSGRVNIKTKMFHKIFAKYPEYVHGGLGVGQGKLIEVNGFLPKEKGRKRSAASIYVVDLENDLRDLYFDVFRCVDKNLAEAVAIEAFPFAAQGYQKNWGYSLQGALRSVGFGLLGSLISDLSFGSLGEKSGIPTQFNLQIKENVSALDVAKTEKKQFFCTQFVAWLYNMVGRKKGKGVKVMKINPKDAYPGALLEAAVRRSKLFKYVGSIRPPSKKMFK